MIGLCGEVESCRELDHVTSHAKIPCGMNGICFSVRTKRLFPLRRWYEY